MKEMTVYLASPLTKFQGTYLNDMPVLVSFALWRGWESRFQQAWGPMLLDSGAYSEFNSGVKVDLGAYVEFTKEWGWRFEAIAGLDDISGDWKRSLKNYESVGFPTFHSSDPHGLLDDLIPIARERGGWLGLGVKPINGCRRYADKWVRATLDRVPDDIHIHGWAMRAFIKYRRLDSVDSTNWFRDAHKLLARGAPLSWLTEGEVLEIVVKRYRREHLICSREKSDQVDLFGKLP